MKPGDHPEFFRFPAPEGRSRESTIRLDREGRFWHGDELVEHAKLVEAFHTWISRHPDDGRYILTNGYDWTYFTVDDAPYEVRALGFESNDEVTLVLSDGSQEPWDPSRTRIGPDGALYTMVKAFAERGSFEARFSRHAQTSLAGVLIEHNGLPAAKIGERIVPIGDASTKRVT